MKGMISDAASSSFHACRLEFIKNQMIGERGGEERDTSKELIAE